MAVVLVLVGGLAIAGERSLQASRETSAGNSVAAFQSWETTYQRSYGGFSGTAANLGTVIGNRADCTADQEVALDPGKLAGYADGSQVLSGYKYTYAAAGGFTGQGGCGQNVNTTYDIIANPVDANTKSFCADSSGVFFLTPGNGMVTTGIGCLTDNPAALPIGQ